jgi:hypothetical protein
MESVVEGLYQRLEEYRRIDYACPYDSSASFQCGSFLLGGMLKEMSRLDFSRPRPEIPFPGLSFDALCGQVQDMKTPRWFYGHRQHPCNLNTVTTTLIAEVSSTIRGLQLGDIKHR